LYTQVLLKRAPPVYLAYYLGAASPKNGSTIEIARSVRMTFFLRSANTNESGEWIDYDKISAKLEMRVMQ
jgi:hypothetical protein